MDIIKHNLFNEKLCIFSNKTNFTNSEETTVQAKLLLCNLCMNSNDEDVRINFILFINKHMSKWVFNTV